MSVTPALDVLKPPLASTGGFAQDVTGVGGAGARLAHLEGHGDNVEVLEYIEPGDRWARAWPTAGGD